MDREQYWALVEKTRPRSNDQEAHSDALIRKLQRLPPAEIRSFEDVFDDLTDEAYRRDLWSVAYAINGGCSDDGFYYFRCWLVMQGQDVFELALAEPESLAEIDAATEEHEGEEYLSVVPAAYEAATGEELPYDFPEEQGRRRKSRGLRGRWTMSDRGVRRKYPMLWRLMQDPPEIDPSWLSWSGGTVRRLAQAIHKDRAWANLPILADALEEAGCTDSFILDHLRAGRRHARSCWVTHFLLNKSERQK